MFRQGGEASPRCVDVREIGVSLLLRGMRICRRQRETIPESELDRPDRSGEMMYNVAGCTRGLERLGKIPEQVAELQPRYGMTAGAPTWPGR